MSNRLSVIIPTLDEATCIGATLQALAPYRARGVEIVVVDGGSRDTTKALAALGADQVVDSAPGRAVQLNAGAAVARGEILLFLHADSQLPGDFDASIRTAVNERPMAWGRFDVFIVGEHPGLAMVATMMNVRSRATGIATGDQGIFVTRTLFDRLQGFPLQPLMEDIEFSKRAKRLSPPKCLRARIRTSGRRWERNGIVRTILLMWRLRLAYFFGADPAALRRRYYDVR